MEVPEGPKFKTYKEGEPIPPVDSEDIRRTWEYDRTHNPVGTKGWDWLLNRQAVCSPGADVWDVAHRHRMIETLITYKLLTPWHHGEELSQLARPPILLARSAFQNPGKENYGTVQKPSIQEGESNSLRSCLGLGAFHICSEIVLEHQKFASFSQRCRVVVFTSSASAISR